MDINFKQIWDQVGGQEIVTRVLGDTLQNQLLKKTRQEAPAPQPQEEFKHKMLIKPVHLWVVGGGILTLAAVIIALKKRKK